MKTRDPIWTGIYRHGAGWRAMVSAGRDQPMRLQHFARETDVREMQAWRADTMAALRLTRKQRAFVGTFAGDAAKYLRAVAALPTFSDRQRDVGYWIAEFGMMRRDRITPDLIRAVRDRWLTEPRSDDDKRALAAGTVNKRLRALSNLYRVLDGAHVPNPVRDVPEAREPDPEPRALDYAAIAAIIDAMPDIDRAEAGHERRAISKTKIRVRCLAYCQITPGQLAALKAADVDLAGKRLRLPARNKGRGHPAIWTRLTPQAVQAFAAFHRHKCYGSFSRSSLRKSFKTAARRAGVPTVPRIYDLRHSFGTAAYRATQSLEAVAALMQHGSTSTTRRYALAAEAQVLAAHGAKVVRAFKKTNSRKRA